MISLLLGSFPGAGRCAYAQEAIPPIENTAIPEEEEEEAEPHPEEEEQKFFIEVREGLLSVELKDAEFGMALGEIAKQAGFGLEINPEVNTKKLSTYFKGLELEKGILRMLNLIREKNYSIYYGEGGKISKIEVTGGGTVSPAGRSVVPPPAQEPGAFPMRRAIPPSRSTERYRSPYVPAPGPVAPKPPAKITISPAEKVAVPPAGDIEELEDMMDEPFVNGDENAPTYIPPKEAPVYIPPQGGSAPGNNK